MTIPEVKELAVNLLKAEMEREKLAVRRSRINDESVGKIEVGHLFPVGEIDEPSDLERDLYRLAVDAMEVVEAKYIKLIEEVRRAA